MPKKTKNDPARPAATPTPAFSPPSPAKAMPRARKGPATQKSTSGKPAAKKTPAPGAAKKSNAKRPPKSAGAAEPSDADIATRAYFIAERRMQLGLPGESAHDWLEARRQLVEEASQKRA